MLVLKKCPQSVFAGMVVSLKMENGNTYLTLRIPYEEVTAKVLGEVHVDNSKTFFCIHLGNEKTFLDELEEIISSKTDIPLEYIFFSAWFVNKYVRKREWERIEKRFCRPTQEELKDREREKWLYKSWASRDKRY